MKNEMKNNLNFRDHVKKEISKIKSSNLKDVLVNTLAVCIADNFEHEILDKTEITYYTLVFLVNNEIVDGPFDKEIFRNYTGFLIADAYNLLCDLFDKYKIFNS